MGTKKPKIIDIQGVIEDSWLEWGTMPQMTQLTEEMMELGVEINKKYIRNKKNDDKLIEEFGDVLSMMQQARFILSKTVKDFDARLEKSMDFKWKRTRRRIDAARKVRGDK
jgi:NTP pyrophosphatase (non-canonical NTP hydrolase)